MPCYTHPVHRSIALIVILPVLLASACDEDPIRWDWRLGDRDAALGDLRPPFSWPEAGDRNTGEVPPPTNERCAGATALTFSTAGKAVTVKASTTAASNEYGNSIRCGESTPFAGPQRYYKVPMTGGKTYRLVLTPQFAAVFYLFSDCSQNIINTDCTSGGATGLFSGAAAAGGSTTASFTAPATGSYRLAVDSAQSGHAGAFELTITELATPKHVNCLTPAELKLDTAGKVSVKGSTLAASNENQKQIACGLGVDFDAPQVYYSVSLSNSTWYRLTLAPTFPGALYVFGKAGNCKATNINADCGGISGTVLPLVSKGSSGATAFRPLLSGTYIVAVDALDPLARGDFSLTVESFTPAGNMTCGQATSLTLAGGKARAKGSTTGMLNDLGAHMACGGGSPLTGPQAYYSVALEKKTYQLALTASFGAALAVGASCLTLAADCGSSGLSGDVLKVASGATGTKLLTPTKAGTYLLAVDGQTHDAAGSFELWVQEYTKPTNGSCAKPKQLTLPSTSPLAELGSTGMLNNDLSAVTCGTTLGPWTGPQAYYKVSLKKGVAYTVTLSPESGFDPALYAFAASTACSAAAINTACKGQSSDQLGGGLTETLTLTPAADTEMLLVVDSWSPSDVGKFTLNIAWK